MNRRVFFSPLRSPKTGSRKGPCPRAENLRMVDGAILASEASGMGSELRPDSVRKDKVR